MLNFFKILMQPSLFVHSGSNLIMKSVLLVNFIYSVHHVNKMTNYSLSCNHKYTNEAAVYGSEDNVINGTTIN